MAPKRKRKAAPPTNKAAKKTKVSDEVQTEPTKIDNPAGPVLYIEHCRSCNGFKRRANDLHSQIVEQVPGITLVLNPSGAPRRGAFEVSIAKSSSDDVADRKELWSRLKKGPQKASKLPSADIFVDAIKKALN